MLSVEEVGASFLLHAASRSTPESRHARRERVFIEVSVTEETMESDVRLILSELTDERSDWRLLVPALPAICLLESPAQRIADSRLVVLCVDRRGAVEVVPDLEFIAKLVGKLHPDG